MLPLPEVVRVVRRQRVMADLTQAQLAKLSGTSQSFIAKLERGRLQPGYEPVRRILEALESANRSDEPVAKDLMRKDPVVADPDEKVATVLARMKKHAFSQMPVVSRGAGIGSVSEATILERLEQGADLEELKRLNARAIMGPGFPTVDPQTRRRALVELLRDRDAVLVAQDGKLLGVVTKSDLW